MANFSHFLYQVLNAQVKLMHWKHTNCALPVILVKLNTYNWSWCQNAQHMRCFADMGALINSLFSPVTGSQLRLSSGCVLTRMELLKNSSLHSSRLWFSWLKTFLKSKKIIDRKNKLQCKNYQQFNTIHCQRLQLLLVDF